MHRGKHLALAGRVLADAISVPADSASILATAMCMPAAHKTEKVEKPDETVFAPRRHFCQLAFSQLFALSSTCI